MRYLAVLLPRPHVLFRASALSALVRGASSAGKDVAHEVLGVGEGGDAGEVIDKKARDAYREEYRRLTSELAEAREAGDAEREDGLLVQVKWMSNQLSQGIDKSGHPRRAKSTTDRVRIAVTKAIGTAMANIAAELPEFGDHLKSAIHTGASCHYSPDESKNWQT